MFIDAPRVARELLGSGGGGRKEWSKRRNAQRSRGSSVAAAAHLLRLDQAPLDVLLPQKRLFRLLVSRAEHFILWKRRARAASHALSARLNRNWRRQPDCLKRGQVLRTSWAFTSLSAFSVRCCVAACSLRRSWRSSFSSLKTCEKSPELSRAPLDSASGCVALTPWVCCGRRSSSGALVAHPRVFDDLRELSFCVSPRLAKLLRISLKVCALFLAHGKASGNLRKLSAKQKSRRLSLLRQRRPHSLQRSRATGATGQLYAAGAALRDGPSV